MSFLALLWKDAMLERRAKQGLQAGLVVVLLFSLTFLFAYPSLHDEPRAGALMVWLPLIFAGVAASGRAIANEAERGTLERLRMAPVPLGWHGLSRTLHSIAVLAVIGAIALAAGALIWTIPVSSAMVVVVALGILGIAITSSITGALAAQTAGREILLPVLAVPALAPLLHAGIQATVGALAGASLSSLQSVLMLMAGYDLLAMGAAWFLWPIVMEAD